MCVCLFSDDGGDDDINEYSELNSSGDASNVQMIPPMTSLNYPTSNYVKHKGAERCLEVPDSYTRASSHTPDHSMHSVGGNAVRGQQTGRIRSNNERERTQNKSQVRMYPCARLYVHINIFHVFLVIIIMQVQKQLELIRSVCDSMLEQQSLNKEQPVGTQNVRNNLTPSPLYSDPRQFASPNPNSNTNALNIMHPVNVDQTWTPSNSSQSNIMFNDASGYQNWLTTNTLQTQAFMLNTLNQCCQMLWLQQRELASLRSMITTMQEKLQTTSYDHPTNSSLPLYVGANSCLYPVTMAPPPPPPSDSRESSQIRSGLANPKMNQVSSATSLPNLNHPHAAHATNTIESAYVNQNNLHNARILESSLNNTVHQNTAGGHANNTLLSGVNQSLPSQIWNGQALNNQVAPGNRANNYWDNFRR